MNLVELVQQQLNLSPSQAEGGIGLLMRTAGKHLDSETFSRMQGAVPDAERLMSAAPEVGGLVGGLSGLLGSFGGKAAQMGSLAELTRGFSQLGLDSDKLQQFLPLVMEFLSQKDGALAERLKGLLH